MEGQVNRTLSLRFRQLRLQANLEKDPAKQQTLIKQADQLRDKAQEIRKAKAAGASN